MNTETYTIEPLEVPDDASFPESVALTSRITELNAEHRRAQEEAVRILAESQRLRQERYETDLLRLARSDGRVAVVPPPR